MKKSNSLIISLLVFSLFAMIASGFSLKSQFDAIDRNDPYYAFEKTQSERFSHVRIHGNYNGFALVQEGTRPEILVYPIKNKDGSPVVTWQLDRDTLIVSFRQDGRRARYFPGIFTTAPYVVIKAPSLNGFVSEEIPATIQGFKADSFSLKQLSFGVLLKENDFESLTADIRNGGELNVQGRNSFGNTDINLKDSSTFRSDRNIFKVLRLHADSTARLDLPGSLFSSPSL